MPFADLLWLPASLLAASPGRICGFAESHTGDAMRNGLALGLMFCAVAGTAAGVGSLAASSQHSLRKNTASTLDHGWQFRQVAPETHDKESEWLPAIVPGDVHLDLLANQKISEPFFRENEAKLQWTEDESWEYRLIFDASSELQARTNLDLVFDGLDAAAQVYVNGVQVSNADNMFRIWRVLDQLKAQLKVRTLQDAFSSGGQR